MSTTSPKIEGRLFDHAAQQHVHVGQVADEPRHPQQPRQPQQREEPDSPGTKATATMLASKTFQPLVKNRHGVRP